jgi:hypothetical protein
LPPVPTVPSLRPTSPPSAPAPHRQRLGGAFRHLPIWLVPRPLRQEFARMCGRMTGIAQSRGARRLSRWSRAGTPLSPHLRRMVGRYWSLEARLHQIATPLIAGQPDAQRGRVHESGHTGWSSRENCTDPGAGPEASSWREPTAKRVASARRSIALSGCSKSGTD